MNDQWERVVNNVMEQVLICREGGGDISDLEVSEIRVSARKIYALIQEGPTGNANYCPRCGTPTGRDEESDEK